MGNKKTHLYILWFFLLIDIRYTKFYPLREDSR